MEKTKIGSKIYKGIEYIQINELPKTQQEKLLKTLDAEMVIKILIDKKIVSNCLQYKDYESWFNATYVTPSNTDDNYGRSLASPTMEVALDKA